MYGLEQIKNRKEIDILYCLYCLCLGICFAAFLSASSSTRCFVTDLFKLNLSVLNNKNAHVEVYPKSIVLCVTITVYSAVQFNLLISVVMLLQCFSW